MERWIDFTPPPPKPLEFLDDGEYICIIRKVEEKKSTRGLEYWHWTLVVKDISPEFKLHYATPFSDRYTKKRLAQLIKACTGKKPKTKILVNPADYVGVTVRVGVKRRIVALRIVNEIEYVKHI